jgi:hypothetical protein
LSDELDILIQRKEAELLPLCLRMDEFKTEFVKETVVFVSKWYKETAKEYVTKYPEVILNMNEEKIAKMKTKINELIGDSERIVKNKLNDPELWWHQKPQLHVSIDQYEKIGDKYPEIIDRAVRRALGHLGSILEAFRFHVAASKNGLYDEFWFENQTDSNQTIPYYPHLLKWSNEMDESINKYNSHFKLAIILYNEIEKLKEQKKKQQAMSRWEST